MERERYEKFSHSIFPVKQVEVKVKKENPFEHHELSIADLASMAQQGKRTLRRIPKAWKVA